MTPTDPAPSARSAAHGKACPAALRAAPLAAAIAAIALLIGCREQPPAPPEPLAERIPHAVLSPQGAFGDPYHWLRDDTRDDPKVLAHLDAENAYADAMLAPLARLRGRLARELERRSTVLHDSAPWHDRGFVYRIQRRADSDGLQLLRRPHGRAHAEQVLLDAEALADGDPRFRVVGWDLSPDGVRLAWLQQRSGVRSFELMLRDPDSGRIVDPGIDGVTSLAWSGDGRWLYLAVADPVTLRSDRVLRLPADGGTALPVHHEADPAFRAVVERTRSGRYVTIGLRATDTSEILVIDEPGAGDEPPRIDALARRRSGHLYSADHVGGSWFVRSNRDTPDFRLYEVPDDDRERWIERAAPSERGMLLEFDVFSEHIAYAERRDGQRRIHLLDRLSGARQTIEPGPAPQMLQLGRNPDPRADHLQFVVSGPATPPTTWRHAFADGARTLLHRSPSDGVDPAAYRVERRWVDARDGARVPVTLVARRDTPLDGRAPLLIEGYGAYGQSLEPRFEADRLGLLDRGFVVALAHVRGGQELGRRWYLRGRGRQKINSINDFIDVTASLAGSGQVDPDRVFAYGASAGGLLVAAAANIAPQHYAGMVVRVPFVDVIQTMLDPSLPLTAQEYREWGDPRQPDQFAIMKRWAPYDNVKRQEYPALLATAALWDAQVPYWGPVKWVARLREKRTNAEPLLLRVDLEGGHDGRTRPQASSRERAAEHAFLLDLAGCAEAETCVGSD
ncbi:S9 family peptidase [Wenzhouxiangella sp. XN79A]|uniref:prolyl oligopeptidase family serine peptidase n=1 Tax=Wenzhouxiangella sp. XN79A TaxID=2724193 RepID=UPI00144AE7F6|nr:prolyl oligopeptidase family serine peptidase [Wenzhouxiangella sp. XN79A]NKI34538.1 S9 family peptidase [Wenzhouxiangella sp. XN79A]